MDIQLLKNWQFKVKGRTGTLFTEENGVKIESGKDASVTELTGPGEYEVSGVSVISIKSDAEIAFVYEIDGLRICNFGKLTDTLAEGKLTLIGDIDILFLPVCAKSIEMMQQIESYFVIPYGYASEEELEKFLKECGLTVKRVPKFSLKKDEIIEDQLSEVVVLESK